VTGRFGQKRTVKADRLYVIRTGNTDLHPMLSASSFKEFLL
jgi:hypothetical protein